MLDVSPNAFSVVPGRVDFTLQVRDLDSYLMDKFVENVCKKFDLRHQIIHRSEPALCDTMVMQNIAKTCDELKVKKYRDALSCFPRCSKLYILPYGNDLRSFCGWYQSFSSGEDFL